MKTPIILTLVAVLGCWFDVVLSGLFVIAVWWAWFFLWEGE